MRESLNLFWNRFYLFKGNLFVHSAGRRLDQRIKRLLAVVSLPYRAAWRNHCPQGTRKQADLCKFGEAVEVGEKNRARERQVVSLPWPARRLLYEFLWVVIDLCWQLKHLNISEQDNTIGRGYYHELFSSKNGWRKNLIALFRKLGTACVVSLCEMCLYAFCFLLWCL